MLRILLSILVLSSTLAASFAADGNKFQKEWDAYLEKDKTSPPPSEAILAIGSSSMRMWGSIKTDLAPLPVFNRAFGGSVTKDTIEAVPVLVIPYKPKVILYYCGDNDLGSPSTSPDVPVNGFKNFVAAVRKELPAVHFVYMSIKPSPKRTDSWPNAQKANAAIKEWCAKDPLMTFIDVGTVLLDDKGAPIPELYKDDHLHMQPAGYERWTKVIKPVLEKVWAEANAKKK
ncbi:MAG TPA: GDSL-type esterase/lipase family protein [Planctomycetota bacterium]|jgi:lysophospholipase L1-like esterase|nr:GDSL-type esterase/lipase family protein [Planctomycetota bacterium]